jgi:hypothetical protein
MIAPSASGDCGIAEGLNADKNIIAGDMETPPLLSERGACSLLSVRICREMSWSRSDPEAVWDAVVWCSSGDFRDGSHPQARGRLSCRDAVIDERESEAVVVAGDTD